MAIRGTKIRLSPTFKIRVRLRKPREAEAQMEILILERQEEIGLEKSVGGAMGTGQFQLRLMVTELRSRRGLHLVSLHSWDGWLWGLTGNCELEKPKSAHHIKVRRLLTVLCGGTQRRNEAGCTGLATGYGEFFPLRMASNVSFL